MIFCFFSLPPDASQMEKCGETRLNTVHCRIHYYYNHYHYYAQRYTNETLPFHDGSNIRTQTLGIVAEIINSTATDSLRRHSQSVYSGPLYVDGSLEDFKRVRFILGILDLQATRE